MNDTPQQQPQQSEGPPANTDDGKPDLQRHAQELGLLGKIFGSSEHAPMNIAGSVLLLCVVAMRVTPFLPISPAFPAGDVVKMFGSIALAALTFLGGYLGGRARS